VTVLLCLPSLMAGAVLLLNLLSHQSIEQWEDTSSAFVALGVLVGIPLVATAAIVGGITALSLSVSTKVKRVQLIVVCLAAIATCCLLIRFGR
jgi:TRAP-type C4-dicarboxylate transport system permease small subunit